MVRIVQQTLEEAIAELRESVRGMEEKHGCDSETMLQQVKSGTEYESREICTWLCEYHALKHLEPKEKPQGN